MAELDYAFLAEFAKVEEGKLTAIGASFTELRTLRLPAHHNLFVAGRLRSTPNADASPMEVQVAAPNGEYSITATAEFDPTRPTAVYADKVAFLFAFSLMIPLPSFGLYSVNLKVGESVRHLKFEVLQANA